MREKFDQSLTEGEGLEVECRMRRASDGAYRWHLARLGPIRDAEGRIARWHAIHAARYRGVAGSPWTRPHGENEEPHAHRVSETGAARHLGL